MMTTSKCVVCRCRCWVAGTISVFIEMPLLIKWTITWPLNQIIDIKLHTNLLRSLPFSFRSSYSPFHGRNSPIAIIAPRTMPLPSNQMQEKFQWMTVENRIEKILWPRTRKKNENKKENHSWISFVFHCDWWSFPFIYNIIMANFICVITQCAMSNTYCFTSQLVDH